MNIFGCDCLYLTYHINIMDYLLELYSGKNINKIFESLRNLNDMEYHLKVVYAFRMMIRMNL